MYMMYRKNNQPIKTQASSWPQFKSGMGLLVIIDDIQLNCTFIKLGVRPKQPAVSSTYGVFPPNSKHHLNLQNICLPVPSLIHQPVVTGKKKTQRGTETSMELNFTISKYNNTVYHVHTALFYSLRRLYQLFSNATHQVKAITIGIFKDDPLVLNQLIVPSSIYLHLSFPRKPQNRYKELFPNTHHFYMDLY